MQTTDYTDLVQPGKLVHFVYIRPWAGACPGGEPVDIPPEVTERVVRVREMTPDGLGFVGDCLRRCAEGMEPQRQFLFRRVAGAREWDGEPIITMGGREIIPRASAVLAVIRERNPELADRLQRQVDRVAAERQQDREAEEARALREAYEAAGEDASEARRRARKEAKQARNGRDLAARRAAIAQRDAAILAARAAKEIAGILPATMVAEFEARIAAGGPIFDLNPPA